MVDQEIKAPSEAAAVLKQDEGSDMDWKSRALLTGGVAGSIIGLLAAFLYIRSAEEKYGTQTPPSPNTGDTVRLGVSLLTIIRTITEWGKNN